MINFPFGTNGKSIILGVPILKHIIVTNKLEEQVFPFNPIALRMAKTLWSFGHYECNRIKS